MYGVCGSGCVGAREGRGERGAEKAVAHCTHTEPAPPNTPTNLRVDLVETPDADDEHELGLGLDVEAALGLGCPLQLH